MICFVCNGQDHSIFLAKCPRCGMPEDMLERIEAGLPDYVGPVCTVLNICWACFKANQWKEEYQKQQSEFFARLKAREEEQNK